MMKDDRTGGEFMAGIERMTIDGPRDIEAIAEEEGLSFGPSCGQQLQFWHSLASLPVAAEVNRRTR
jgi:hypothetical protein